MTAAASFPPSTSSIGQPLAADEAIDATEAQDVFSPAVIADCLLVLGSKQADRSNYFAYYAGTAAPPLVADRLREIYRDLNFVLSENWLRRRSRTILLPCVRARSTALW